MADGKATFTLELEDQTSSAAQASAQSLEQMREAIQGDIVALRNMQSAMRAMKGGTTTNAAAFKNLKDQITAQKDKVANAQAAYVGLGGTFAKINKPPKDQKVDQLNQLAGALQAAGGPMGQFNGKLAVLQKLMGAGIIVGGLLAVAAAIVAVTAASVAAASALVKYGLAQASAHRDEKLRLEGLTKMRFWYMQMGFGARRAQDSVSMLQGTIDKVSASTSLSRGEVESWTNKLYKMGLRGGNLQAALKGVVTAEAAVGAGQAQMYASMMAGAQLTGQSVKALAGDIEARLGDLARRKAMSLDVQIRKLKENLSRLFHDVKLERFLGSLKVITDMFSSNAVVGRALKGIVERMFSPLESSVPTVAEMVKNFIEGMIIGYLKTEVAIYKVANALLENFGPAIVGVKEQLDKIDFAKHATTIGKFALGFPVGLLTAGAVALGGVATAAGSLVFALSRLKALFTGTAKELKDLKPTWQDAGTAIVDGIMNGMLGGWPKLIGQIAKGGKSLLAAFKGAIGARSPARLFMPTGGDIPGGIAVGIKKRTHVARQAVQDMLKVTRKDSTVSPMREPKATSASQPQARASRTWAPTVNVAALNITAASGEPNDIEAAVRAGLRNALEGIAIEMGAA